MSERPNGLTEGLTGQVVGAGTNAYLNTYNEVGLIDESVALAIAAAFRVLSADRREVSERTAAYLLRIADDITTSMAPFTNCLRQARADGVQP